jgi:hypothetical protein
VSVSLTTENAAVVANQMRGIIGSFAARRNTLDLSLDIPPRPRSGAFYVPQRRQERVGEELREINERWGFPEVKKE